MEFGVCAPIEQAPVVHAAGYDFIECTVVSLQAERSDAEVRDRLAQFTESPVPVAAFNVMLPGDLKIVGERVDEARVRRYLEKALERVKRAGGATVVFGSGKARAVPDGFAREKAEEQIVRFLEWTADVADPLGVTIAIEPLNMAECNIITTVPEAVRFARHVNRRSIRVLADFYHMRKDGEPYSHVIEHRELLHHVHVADTRRFVPAEGDEAFDAFAECVRRANYDGRLSVECSWNRFEEEAAAGLNYLKRIFPA
ncbi:sugar phosphate isomerase/epimerase family protein [Paenibacillus sp. GYB003]|uniref:sugar phosphate isomerase/epimerase family protein n=1 Tax=Paenibacillus sp. GYB003 TaxID=2994392 RepID=UPI002F9689A5